MCSINGVYGSLDSSDISWARKAQDMLKYRGPDESDSSLDERCSLNSNRFSITGVDNGTMPISNEDGTIQVILNGEVYNHKELRKELEGEGHRFTKDSDTETIVHLYEKYGENCFEHIEGMYAVAIYDSKNDRLVVGRDPFGQKPLFYVEKEGKIYFASEHRALLDLTSREVSNDALAQYFSLGFSINPLVEGIKRLQAGTYVVADSNGVKVERHWNPVFVTRYDISFNEAVGGFIDRLNYAVDEMTPREVKYGTLLSGGVDSATIFKLLGQPYAFSSGLESLVGNVDITGQDSDFGAVEIDCNEFKYADIAARSVLNGELHKRIFGVEEFKHTLPEIIMHLPQGPIGNTSFPIWYYASQLMNQQGFRVAMAGEGADEVLGGYRTNNPLEYSVGSVEEFGKVFGWAPREYLSRLLKGRFNDPFAIAQEIVDRDFFSASKEKDRFFNQLRFMVGYGLVMAPHMLERADGMTMVQPVEVRLPFLHRGVAEYLYSLPTDFFIKSKDERKVLLKSAAAKLGVHPEIVNRPKQRTSLPYLRLLREHKEHAPYFQGIVTSKGAKIREYIQDSAIKEIVEKDTNPRKLWQLIMLETYLQEL